MGVKISERAVDALTTVVELEGDLDLYSASAVNDALSRARTDQCRRLVVDLGGVTSIDFSTIAILAHNGRLLAARHGTLEVVCADGEMRRLLAAAGDGGRFVVRAPED